HVVVRRLDLRRRASVEAIGGRLRAAVAVERLQLFQVDALDVAADAPFAERQRHPRLEVRDDARFGFRMLVEIEVQAVGPSVHQLLQPRRAAGVDFLHLHRIDEQLLAEVAVDLLFAFRLGEPADAVDEVQLDAVEVVFRLRVDRAEDRVGVRFPVHMRDAPVVARDRDALRLLLPARDLLRIGGGGAAPRRALQNECENDLLHWLTLCCAASTALNIASSRSSSALQPAGSMNGFGPPPIRGYFSDRLYIAPCDASGTSQRRLRDTLNA